MISEYLFKGIDNILPTKLVQKTATKNKAINRDLIKANLHSVVKNNKNNENVSPLKKSRLRTIL